MKAYVLHGINDIRYEEVETPSIGEGQLLIKVKAAGICGSDIPRIYQTGAHKHPLIPGHEFSGQVVKCGGLNYSYFQDKRVGIFPLIPCMECGPCKTKQYEMCKSYSYLGSRTDGGFAEYVVVPARNVIELPEKVSYEAAAMLEPMAVAVHSIRKLLFVSGIKDIEKLEDKELEELKNKSIVVLGLGTIGLLIVMFLRQLGMKNIFVVGNKAFQKKQAEKLGITEDNYCDSNNNDIVAWINAKTNQTGAELLFECVGKNETVSSIVEAAAPSASIVFVGNPFTDMSFDKQVYWKILRSQLHITGTWNSSFTGDESDDWHYVINCLSNAMIDPEQLISHRFKLEELEQGLTIMRDKTEDYVKVMCVM